MSELTRAEAETAEVVCLEAPEYFQAVGQFYREFEQRFGIKFTSVYALSDCGMVTTRGPADPGRCHERPRRTASAGAFSLGSPLLFHRKPPPRTLP